MKVLKKQSLGSKNSTKIKTQPNLLVIVPAFNEAKIIFSVLKNLAIQLKTLKPVASQIIVVDDGSTDQTWEQAKKAKAKVIRHPINRGLGGALGTGLIYAKKHHFDYVVTFDADGQHDARQIRSLIAPLIKGKADVVIGSRTLTGWQQLPLDRRLIIFLSNLLTNLLFATQTTDSQSGFRAFNQKALQAIKIRTQRMEVSSELFAEIKTRQLRYQEIPISVIYSPYSRQKGQSNLNAFAILFRLLLRLFR